MVMSGAAAAWPARWRMLWRLGARRLAPARCQRRIGSRARGRGGQQPGPGSGVHGFMVSSRAAAARRPARWRMLWRPGARRARRLSLERNRVCGVEVRRSAAWSGSGVQSSGRRPACVAHAQSTRVRGARGGVLPARNRALARRRLAARGPAPPCDKLGGGGAAAKRRLLWRAAARARGCAPARCQHGERVLGRAAGNGDQGLGQAPVSIYPCRLCGCDVMCPSPV